MPGNVHSSGINAHLLAAESVLACRRGVCIAGATFGVLHTNGGRNVEFAAWASAVGILYGAAFLSTQDLLVPMAAHALGNLASALIWRQQNLRNNM